MKLSKHIIKQSIKLSKHNIESSPQKNKQMSAIGTDIQSKII